MKKHSKSADKPVFDAEVRVVIVVEPTGFVAVDGGLTESELRALTELLDRPGNDEALNPSS